MNGPSVSVVVPTYQRPRLLRRCLRALLAQRMPADQFEIIVVDDGHQDLIRRLVCNLQQPRGPLLRYLRPANGKGPAVARNAGWRAARAPLIAFTDDDTIPQSDWLAQGCLAMQSRPEFSALCGVVRVPLPPSRESRPTDHERMTKGLELAEFVTANAFVQRWALAIVGGFDERFQRAWREDSDLQFRLQAIAGPVGRAPEAVVLHPVRPERWGVSLRQQRNIVFDALLYRKHPLLYRTHIRPQPPWDYYGIVVLSAAALVLALAGWGWSAAGAALAALALIFRFAMRRLHCADRSPGHVLEMLLTSVLIPYLSVFWRLAGSWRFRVPFL